MLSDRATILDKRGQRADAIRTLEEALTYAQGLSPAQASPRTRAALEKELAALRSEPQP